MFSKNNKEFLIFLFFLCLSSIFWLLMALNETYDREIAVPVRLKNVPSGVVMTSAETDTVRVTVRDKGYFIISYVYGNAIRGVDIDYATHTKTQDCVKVTAAELQKSIYPQLYGSSQITAVKPDKCEFYYTKGESKVVPVELNGKIQAANNYYLAKVSFSPATVSAYASESIIDDVTVAQTELLSIMNVTDTVTQTVTLKTANGVKYVPSTVTLTVCPDILIEETTEVAVTAVNMPDGKVLRTFPSKVSVSFTVGASMFRSLDMSLFVVEADYDDIASGGSDKCKLYLRSYPEGVHSASLKTEQVDYLIEEQ